MTVSSAAVLAMAALLPAMTGPVGGGRADAVVALCGGGAATVPLNGGGPGPASQPCCAKGCHTGGRKRVDRGQCA